MNACIPVLVVEKGVVPDGGLGHSNEGRQASNKGSVAVSALHSLSANGGLDGIEVSHVGALGSSQVGTWRDERK
jgi:hypothetical protein